MSDVIKFLMGIGPLDDCWYGERPADKGPYWWRNALEKEIESLIQQLESARKDAEEYRRKWLESLPDEY